MKVSAPKRRSGEGTYAQAIPTQPIISPAARM